MGSLVSYFQDILIHGQDIRSVRKSIGDINPDYQVFSDHGSFAPDDFRKLNYAGWGASGLASLTLLNKRALTSHIVKSTSGGMTRNARGD
jgi:hypothetical protein